MIIALIMHYRALLQMPAYNLSTFSELSEIPSTYIPCVRKTAVRHQSCQWIKAASTILSITNGDLKCIDLKYAKDVIDFFFGEALS